MTSSPGTTSAFTVRGIIGRLLGYYEGCLRAEESARATVIPGSNAVLVLEHGPSPLGGGDVLLGADARTQRWTVERRTSGELERVVVGHPVVPTKDDDGRLALAPLLLAEAELPEASPGTALRVRPETIELGVRALELLGLPRHEAEVVAEQFSDRTSIGFESACRWLVEREILPRDSDWASLGAIGMGGPIVPAAVVFISDGSGAINRNLFADFHAMKAAADDAFERGPLRSLILGSEAGDPRLPHVTPSVLPSNAEQEVAITSAMERDLTVVTGPPGTGKTQVLVNTVATALALGEKVLLASKNNHALDVVVQRIRDAHPDAAPVRVGRASLRGPAAEAMLQALARPAINESGRDLARERWYRMVARWGGAYAEMRDRVEIANEVARLSAELEELRRVLPEGIDVLTSADEVEYLVDAHRATSARLAELLSLPPVSFWRPSRRRRLRSAESELRRASKLMVDLVGSAASVTTLLLDADLDRVLRVVGDVIRARQVGSELQSARFRLAALPDPSVSETGIAESFAHRVAAAQELYGSSWRHAYRRRGDLARGRAASYAERLANVAASGSGIQRLRPLMPNTLDAFPVWAITSLAAGAMLPIEPRLFDLVIIDEASQSDIASALPLLFRAKRAMIIGDPNQLMHVTTLSARVDDVLARQAQLSDREAADFGYRSTSLYTLAAAKSPADPVLLRHHFRSHRDIIGFSNEAFYGGQLKIDTDREPALGLPAMRWIDVVGTSEPGSSGRSLCNQREADAAIAAAVDIASAGASVGIVSPFRAQVDLLRRLLSAIRPDLVGEITIDTAHGFQGDERDAMVLSPVVSRVGTSDFAMRHAGNPNLLNVAVTRARFRLEIVGDHGVCRDSETVLAVLARYAADLAS